MNHIPSINSRFAFRIARPQDKKDTVRMWTKKMSIERLPWKGIDDDTDTPFDLMKRYPPLASTPVYTPKIIPQEKVDEIRKNLDACSEAIGYMRKGDAQRVRDALVHDMNCLLDNRQQEFGGMWDVSILYNKTANFARRHQTVPNLPEVPAVNEDMQPGMFAIVMTSDDIVDNPFGDPFWVGEIVSPVDDNGDLKIHWHSHNRKSQRPYGIGTFTPDKDSRNAIRDFVDTISKDSLLYVFEHLDRYWYLPKEVLGELDRCEDVEWTIPQCDARRHHDANNEDVHEAPLRIPMQSRTVEVLGTRKRRRGKDSNDRVRTRRSGRIASRRCNHQF